MLLSKYPIMGMGYVNGAIYIYSKLYNMKKLFFLAAIAFAVSATAQVKGFDPKKIDTKSTKAKAAASLKEKKANKGSGAFTSTDDCGAFTKTETDKDGTQFQSAKDFLIVSSDGVTGLAFTMSNFMLEGSKYVMLVGVALEKATCVEKGATKIVINYEDGTQATFPNFQADNCDGIVKTFFGKKLENEAALNDLKTKKVKSIKVTASEKTIIKTLSENNQIQLQGTIKCLS
jgi:hypothetical protein